MGLDTGQRYPPPPTEDADGGDTDIPQLGRDNMIQSQERERARLATHLVVVNDTRCCPPDCDWHKLWRTFIAFFRLMGLMGQSQ
jgi:hypothetical protein